MALLRIRPRSEPAWGSVRFIVPVHSPETILCRKRCFCSSLPRRNTASIAPWVSSGAIENAMFDAFHISITAVSTSLGSPWPPKAGSKRRPFQPDSTNLAYASTKPLGVVTRPSSWRFRPCWSPTLFSGPQTSPEKVAAPSSTASTSSVLTSP